MSELNKFIPSKKRLTKLTTVAVCITSIIIASQTSWPYFLKAVRPWAETPMKVDALNAKVDLIMKRLGMNEAPKPPENPYLPPRLQGAWGTNYAPAVAQGDIETTNRTKL